MAKDKMTTCKHCGQEIAASAKICPHCGGKNKPPIYKRGWFIALIVLIILYAIGSSDSSSNTASSTSTSASSTKAEVSSSSSSVTVSSSVESDSSTSEIPSTPTLSEDEYRAECETVKYKDLCRYPDQYAGKKSPLPEKSSRLWMPTGSVAIKRGVFRPTMTATVITSMMNTTQLISVRPMQLKYCRTILLSFMANSLV